jgi:Fe-S cluster biogenesis protein NfuA
MRLDFLPRMGDGYPGREGKIMEEKVKTFIEEIRPYIQSHGGDVEFVSLEGNVVKLKLLGACRSCSGAVMTLHNGIEVQLKELVSPDLVVERVL